MASDSARLRVHAAQLNGILNAALTRVVHRVPHVEAADVAELTVGVAFEDQLWRETGWSHESLEAL